MESLLAPALSPEPRPEKKRYRVLAYLGIALGLFLALLRAWVWSYGIVNAGMLGYAFGSATAPALIAYLIAGRKSVRNFNRFAVSFSGLSLLFFSLGSKPPVSLSQHVGNLMKEAAGTKPVDTSGPRSMDELIRDVMRGVLEQRKSFDQETSQFTVELGRLYSVESFSSPDSMKRSLDAVRGVVAADLKYSQQLDDLPKRIEGRVQSSSLSDSDKRDFIEGIQHSLGSLKALAIRKQAVEVETQWSAATIGLYEFTMQTPGRSAYKVAA
jgi:hypothetical protein